MTKFRPLHDRVLVRRVTAEEKTAGGIIIPDTALDVKPGDRILFGKWSGTEVKVGGEELLIMKESDIMGIVETPAVAKAA
jgi:chaperonin GroES